ncbi:MAG: 2-oxo acid dehydrogenase subunit E2, partial [Candidatus Omnitrophica bacterium]|nr:2-oxo acid dehydrogenase subunit E2 [Candidatus Omnitrophota bacterium]
MAQPILMPKLGQTVEESTIVRWHKKEGDKIAKGDIIFEIETDKAVLECESFVEGTLLKIVVPEGQPVPVQSTVGFVGEPGEKAPEVEAPKPVPAPKADIPAPLAATQTPAGALSQTPATPQAAARSLRSGLLVGLSRAERGATAMGVPPVGGPSAPPAGMTSQIPAPPGKLKISPRARALVKKKVIAASKITGTGPGGRIVEKDVKAYLESQGYDNIRITPAAKNLAAQEDIDILTLSSTGDSNRVSVADVKRAIAEKPEPMNKMRRIIGERLTYSFSSIPHIFVTVSVDMTDLFEYRAELKKKGLPYTVTDFIMKAVTMSLTEYPMFNSNTDGVNVSWNSRVNLGLAVSLEKGLVVPVISQAEDLSLAELHDTAADLAAKAREGKLPPDDMQGGSFTISNMGMLKVENFTA